MDSRRLDSAESWQMLMQGGWAVRSHSCGPRTRTLITSSMADLPPERVLTAREMCAAALRAKGEPFKVVGSELGRSAACACHYVARATRKLMLGSVSDLVSFFAAWPKDVVAHALVRDDEESIVVTYNVPLWSIPHCLSAAERRVVHHLLAGESHTSVARACGIAPRTVANHVASVHRKLNVHSRIELVGALCDWETGATPTAG